MNDEKITLDLVIDVQKDFFEEISNDSEIHKLTGNRGSASEKLYQLCDTMVAPEYRPLIRPFRVFLHFQPD